MPDLLSEGMPTMTDPAVDPLREALKAARAANITEIAMRYADQALQGWNGLAHHEQEMVIVAMTEAFKGFRVAKVD